MSYDECVKKKEIFLLQASGNDLVAANALASSGEIKAKAESLDKHELAIFKDGVTL